MLLSQGTRLEQPAGGSESESINNEEHVSNLMLETEQDFSRREEEYMAKEEALTLEVAELRRLGAFLNDEEMYDTCLLKPVNEPYVIRPPSIDTLNDSGSKAKKNCRLLAYINGVKELVALGRTLGDDAILKEKIHFKSLETDHYKVQVIVDIMSDAFIPVPSSELSTVGEALKSFCVWPKDLVTFNADEDVDATFIATYLWILHEKALSMELQDYYGFVNPMLIVDTILIGSVEERALELSNLMSHEYKAGKVYFVSFLHSSHWMLAIVNPSVNTMQWCDSDGLGPRPSAIALVERALVNCHQKNGVQWNHDSLQRIIVRLEMKNTYQHENLAPHKEQLTKFLLQRVIAFFSTWSKCDIVDNNLTEAYNATAVEARAMPVLTMFESLRVSSMIRNMKKRDKVDKWHHAITPRVVEQVDDYKDKTRYCKLLFGVRGGWEVHEGDDTYVVNVAARSCTCRVWNMQGVPCKHDILVLSRKKEPR
ncbi:hypothetical protein ACFE04_031194 [Oxalis oulophora]